jgi:acetyl-CoA acetyltransferase
VFYFKFDKIQNHILIKGLAQCAELCWQLRNQAGKRQVKNARIGLQHNIGLGGACVVAIYRLASFNK